MSCGIALSGCVWTEQLVGQTFGFSTSLNLATKSCLRQVLAMIEAREVSETLYPGRSLLVNETLPGFQSNGEALQ